MPLVVFEGAEGCGKSTQMALLAQSLRDRGLTVHCTREPGGTPLAEQLRQVFKSVPAGDAPTVLTEVLTIMAARAQHTARVLKPALETHQWILCDRYLDSSYVYQGLLGGLSKAYIDAVAQPVVGPVVPHLTLVYLAPGPLLQHRIAQRSPLRADRFDGAPAHHLEAMNQGFLQLCQEGWPYPNGAVPLRLTIDGTPPPHEVFAYTWRSIEALLASSQPGASQP